MAYIVTDRTGRYLLERLLSGQQADHQPDRQQRPYRRENDPDHPGYGPNRTASWSTPPTSMLRNEPWRRHHHGVEVRSGGGTLSPNGPGEVQTKPGAGPRHLALHPNGRFLYLITETTRRSAPMRSTRPRATLSELQFVDTGARQTSRIRPAASDIHVTPNGRFLYGSERTTSTLARVPHRFRQGHALADRQFPDREDAARLQHRPARPLSAVGRARIRTR